MTALIVQTTRGAVVELESRVDAVIVDGGGRVTEAFGTVDRRLPLRSTAKPLQALALVESGAADALGVTETELTLACASHNGEDGHATAVESWLARLGLGEDDLQCGAVLRPVPLGDGQATLTSTPSRLRHNCSGKHSGFLTLATHLGADPANYLDRTGETQRAALAIVSERCGMSLDDDDIVRDGCGAPCPCISLESLARGWATMMVDAAGSGTRIRSAIASHSWYLAGTGRFDTAIVELTAGRVFSKLGAAGMHIAMAPELGLVVATKAVDGSHIAADEALVHLLVRSGALTAHEAEQLPRAAVLDDAGSVVGSISVRG
jgi:L-asparaginase II